jgi:GDP-D-mannose dehydratase
VNYREAYGMHASGYFLPTEVDVLQGDATKSRAKLG